MQELPLSFGSGKPVDLVIDTDAYNEIDDQFAIVYALLSPEHMRVKAIYAAPFENSRVDSYGDGMERSFDEIIRVLGLLGLESKGLVLRGAVDRFGDHVPSSAVSDASRDIVKRARAKTPEAPLVVVAIGAATNFAAALNEAPDIADRVVFLWLGGHPSDWPHNREFNLRGDPEAVRFIMNSSVRVVRFPCATVAEALKTNISELRENVAELGDLGAYLFDIFENYDHDDLRLPAATKTIWDLAPFAWIVDQGWFDMQHSDRMTLDKSDLWIRNEGDEKVWEAIRLWRDPVFRNLYSKIGRFHREEAKPRLG